MHNSLWASNAELPRFPKLKKDIKTDVLIVGGGLAGLLCAYRLDRAGVEYVLIEADRICRGVTRNTTAKITSQHGFLYDKLIREFGPETARAYWEANEAALGEYRKLAESIECDFETKDNYIYSKDPETLEKEMAALYRLGIPAEFVNTVNLPVCASGAIRFRNQAQFHPLKFAAAISEGLNIYEETKAKEFIGNTVVTEGGRITASKIIMATHFPIINKHGAYFLKMYQQRSYVLALEGAENVDGMYLGAEKDGLSFRSQGSWLLLGGGSHRTGKPSRAWEPLEAFAKAHYPDAEIRYRWATQDCMTLDGVPYIGRYSRRTPGLYVATGFNKWGMTSSMVSAMILSDLVRGKGSVYASVFDPSRTILRPQLLYNTVESAANLCKISRPRCPHLGCALHWNSQEHSWDCACHGSRFGENGELLDNPATDGLGRNAT